jgi:Flp pilus assembly protein TadG
MWKIVASRGRIILSRFSASRSGNVASIFALAVLPMFALHGRRG